MRPQIDEEDSHAPRPATTPPSRESFDDVVVPHLDAARRLARWLVRNEHDAEDVVQEASLRAFRYFGTFMGGNGRAWFLRIVRNTCHAWLGQRMRAATDLFDEKRHSGEQPVTDPEAVLWETVTASAIERAMRGLPDRLREMLALRELNGLSYRELAEAMGVPMGTVMSGLSRARQALRAALRDQLDRSGSRPAMDPREGVPVLRSLRRPEAEYFRQASGSHPAGAFQLTER